MSHYLYILTHPSLAGKIKIGRTLRAPQARAEELTRSEGRDAPYQVAHAEAVTHGIAAEQLAHIQLMEAGYCMDSASGCFDMPLQEAVRIVAAAAAEIRNVFPEAAGLGPDVIRNVDEAPAPAGDHVRNAVVRADPRAADRMASYRRPGVLSRWMVVARPRIARM